MTRGWSSVWVGGYIPLAIGTCHPPSMNSNNTQLGIQLGNSVRTGSCARTGINCLKQRKIQLVSKPGMPKLACARIGMSRNDTWHRVCQILTINCFECQILTMSHSSCQNRTLNSVKTGFCTVSNPLLSMPKMAKPYSETVRKQCTELFGNS